MAKEFASKTLHCVEGTSDKVDQVVLESTSIGTFNVVAKWGRRGGTMQEQVKESSVSVHRAMAVMDNLLAAKYKKGYNDLDLTKDIGKAAKVQPKVQVMPPPKLLPMKHEAQLPTQWKTKVEEDYFVPVGNTQRRIKE